MYSSLENTYITMCSPDHFIPLTRSGASFTSPPKVAEHSLSYSLVNFFFPTKLYLEAFYALLIGEASFMASTHISFSHYEQSMTCWLERCSYRCLCCVAMSTAASDNKDTLDTQDDVVTPSLSQLLLS